MINCDMCYKGIIRVTMKGEEIICKWCNGSGELESKNKYKLHQKGLNKDDT